MPVAEVIGERSSPLIPIVPLSLVPTLKQDRLSVWVEANQHGYSKHA
jgi:hypothetical protein